MVQALWIVWVTDGDTSVAEAVGGPRSFTEADRMASNIVKLGGRAFVTQARGRS